MLFIVTLATLLFLQNLGYLLYFLHKKNWTLKVNRDMFYVKVRSIVFIETFSICWQNPKLEKKMIEFRKYLLEKCYS